MSKNIKENNQQTSKFDLTVIEVAQLESLQQYKQLSYKKKVCIIEKNPEKLGGSWIFWGHYHQNTSRKP